MQDQAGQNNNIPTYTYHVRFKSIGLVIFTMITDFIILAFKIDMKAPNFDTNVFSFLEFNEFIWIVSIMKVGERVQYTVYPKYPHLQ